jgi:hypothetical protein
VLHHGPAYRGHALPYAFGTHLQRVWLSQRVVQERVFAEHSRLFWRCLGDAGLEDPKREHLTRNLMVNTWTHWRRRSLVSPPNFSRWVATSGTDHLKTASRQQNGLILVFVHQVISVTLARIPLRDCGICEELVVTGGWPDFATKTALIRRTMSAQAGIEVLRRGGAVLIAGDGRSSTNPMSVPFYRNVCATRWQNA